MSQKSHFLEGLFLGAIIGSVLALLFAPSSGEETRKKLKKFKEDNEELIINTKDKTDDLIKKTKDAIESGFEKLSTMIEEKKGSKKNYK